MGGGYGQNYGNQGYGYDANMDLDRDGDIDQ
jgi:hypothetical protein